MRPVLLIGANFLREQRWPLGLLLVFVVLYSGLAGLFSSAAIAVDDVLFFVKQQAIYGIAFTGFLAASAIYNERRSKRILAVLSKAVTRSQYIAGLMVGTLAAAAMYCVAVGTFGAPMFARVGLPPRSVWLLATMLMAACALTSAVTMFFSTFLHPLFAMAVSALALSFTAVMSRLGLGWENVLPVYGLMDRILSFGDIRHWIGPWAMISWALADAAVLWLAASCVFSFRDVAVSVE